MGTESNAITIHELLHDRCIYQMPLFQREYQWREEDELDKFWRDLSSVIDDEIDASFLGAIVLQIERPGSSKYSQVYTVIDGQQRITTFFLLICAIVNFARDRKWDDTADDLEKQYLVSGLSAEKGNAKLVPTFKDNSNFNEVVKSIKSSAINLLPDTGTNDGPMILAYMYFWEQIEDFVSAGSDEPTEERLESLYNSLLDRMEVVQIILDKSHNANEVFDRLNTAGRPLSTIDLVRNELFQTVSEDYKKANDLYTAHWEPFEKYFDGRLKEHKSKNRSKIVDGFFFPYALTHLTSAKKNNLLPDLRKIWAGLTSVGPDNSDDVDDIDPVSVLKSLEAMQAPYLAVDQGIKLDNVSDALWVEILNLRRIPMPGVAHPYFMKLLSEVARENTPDAHAISVCNVIESFFVRRGLVGLEPTGLHSIFKKLWEDAGADAGLVAKSIQTGTISFPNDEEVRNAVLEKGLYKKRVEKFVLWSYEMSLQNKSFSQLSYLPRITADHVMPQKWQGEWKKVISESDHEAVVHLWGNIVPLSSSENSAKGTKSFQSAKAILSNETAFLTTKRLMNNLDSWNRDAIINRSEELSSWAIKRWPRPGT